MASGAAASDVDDEMTNNGRSGERRERRDGRVRILGSWKDGKGKVDAAAAGETAESLNGVCSWFRELQIRTVEIVYS